MYIINLIYLKRCIISVAKLKEIRRTTFLQRKFHEDNRIYPFQRMSFIFPVSFYRLLLAVSMRYNRDMTYIMMEALNEWVMKREGINLAEDFLLKENPQRNSEGGKLR